MFLGDNKIDAQAFMQATTLECGVKFDPPLTDVEVKAIENVNEITLPPELVELLKIGVPRSEWGFTDWRKYTKEKLPVQKGRLSGTRSAA